MTDLERFTQTMTMMMGGDLMKHPESDLVINKKTWAIWSPITPEGELTAEVRKWWAENLPEEWEEYCDFIYCDIDFTNIRTFYSEVLAAQLSAENLWKWMRENADSWLMEPCMPCSGVGGSRLPDDEEDYDLCPECNGTGHIAKWDVEKWLEGK